MKQILYVAVAFLSVGLGTSVSIAAATSNNMQIALMNDSSPVTQTTPNEKDEQAQMAAWLIESAKVANDYVNMLDQGQYVQSWTKGDQIFQHTINKEEWTKALNDNRKPLGKVKSRKLKDQRPAMNPQGLPRGAYMVVEYDTSFEQAPNSGELLTLRRGSDGVWRVLTYQVN